MGEKRKTGFVKGLVLGIALTAVVTVAAGRVRIFTQTGTAPTDERTQQKIRLIEDLIDKNYLEDVDEASMTDSMLKGLLQGIGDDYADYYSKDEYKEILSSTQGDYRGIGIIMQQSEETNEVLVVGVYKDTPADKAGIKAGDMLIQVDDILCKETALERVAAAIKTGEADTVHLILERDSESYEVDVTKEDIQVPVVGSEMLEEQIGCIQITQFTGLTPQQFAEHYEDLKKQQMKALIMHLRHNPGGLVDSAVDTLCQILPEGLVVYMQTKDGTKTEYSCDGETPIDIPMVVLVNEYSASASEIFAGAVHDYGVGTLVGTTTYGKGIVQKTFPFTDGSAVKMTIAYYYTPSGTCIHGEGIEPDVKVELPQDAQSDLQLEKALEVLKKQL